MNSPSYIVPSCSDLAACFWPLAQPLHRDLALSRIPLRAAANLYELFEQKLSLLVAGACQADHVARALFVALAVDEVGLRQQVLGLAKSARGCLPALPVALGDEGLLLPPTLDVVIDVLLTPINPELCGPGFDEPRSVAGARMIDTFTHVALHFEMEASRAADDAWLLGSKGLHHALAGWAAMWSDCLCDLKVCAKNFRLQAYVADLEPRPCGHAA